jgi:hypothetical protein
MDEVVFAFESFRLISAEHTLFGEGRALRPGSSAFDILVALIERAGQTVPKEELIARAWPDTVVEEAALRVHVAALCKALGDGRDGKRYIANRQPCRARLRLCCAGDAGAPASGNHPPERRSAGWQPAGRARTHRRPWLCHRRTGSSACSPSFPDHRRSRRDRQNPLGSSRNAAA